MRLYASLYERIRMEKKNCFTGRLDAKAFTLIELLVVVLIIGILAAVALPQYQKAVEKSKATQGMSLVKSFAQAAEAYHLANGTYVTTNADIESLDIGLSDQQKNKFLCADLFGGCGNSGEWGISLMSGANLFYGVIAIRTTGKYAGAGFVIFQKVPAGYPNISTNTLYCYERYAGSYVVDKGSYCKKLFSGTYIPEYVSNAYLFALP